MTTLSPELASSQTASRGARLKNVAQKVGRVMRHPGQSFRGFFGYADGRLWAPERDVEHPRMRRIALGVGKTAIVAGKIAKAYSHIYEGPGLINITEVTSRNTAKRVDMILYDHARHKLTNALLEDSLSGGTTTYSRNSRVPVTKDPRIATLPRDEQTELMYASVSALRIMAEHGIDVDLDNDDTRTAVGRAFHGSKLRRHSPASGYIPDEQRVPFEQLPAAVQNSEIHQMQIAQNLFSSGHPGLQEALQRVFTEQIYVTDQH